MDHAHKPYLIVVGVDYSEVSHLAFRAALREASRGPESELHVIHVQTALSVYQHSEAKEQPYESDARALAVALERLQHFVARELAAFQEEQRKLGQEPFAKVVSHLRRDAPGEEISQLAADLEADLVVVGTHGRTGLARLLLGSVAHKVVTLAPCPVLVVRPKQLPLSLPTIEAPCARCLEARKQSAGRELWCDEHREHHGQRHTYHQGDRAGAETNFPLVFERK